MSVEEADEILLLSLRRSNIPLPKGQKSLREVTPEALVKIVVHSLRSIKGIELPDALPTMMSGRHRLCTSIAAAVKELGYSGDMGFNQLLYPNEKDTRRLLSWLVSKLPRVEDKQTAGATATASSQLLRNFKGWSQGLLTTDSTKIYHNEAVFHSIETLSGPASAPSGNLSSGLKLAASLARKTAVNDTDNGANTLKAITADVLLLRDAGTSLASGVADTTGIATSNFNTVNTCVSLDSLQSAAASSHKRRWNVLRSESRITPVFSGSFLDSYPSPFNRVAAFAIPPAVAGGSAPFSVGASTADATKTEEEIAAEREAEIQSLTLKLDALNEELQRLADQKTFLLHSIPVLRAQLHAVEEEQDVLAQRYLVRKDCLEMLPEAATHISRLAEEVTAYSNKLLTLAEQWEQHRLPLMNAIHEALAQNAVNSDAATRMQAALSDVRTQMSELAVSMATKEEAAAALAAQWARLKESTPGLGLGDGEADLATRPSYTRRIMDIVRQIRKQKAEIGKIVKDVRTVQQEINDISEKLQRTTAIATDAMEKAAQDNAKDAAYRQVLRHLITLQEIFQQLITASSALGHTENDIRQVENRIEQMTARNDARNMDDLLRDLHQIRAENEALEKAIPTA